MTGRHTTRADVEAASEAGDRRCVYHLVIISTTSSDRVLTNVLPDDKIQLPSIVLPTAPKCPNDNYKDQIATRVRDQLGLNVRIVRHIWNGIYNRFHSTADVEEQRVLLLTLLDEEPDLRAQIKWISRERAFGQKWERTSDDKENFVVQTMVEESFRYVNGEDRGLIDMPWFNPGWSEMMTSWVKSELLSRDLILEDRVREANHGVDSLVMRCKVKGVGDGGEGEKENSEVLYVKAGVPVFREAERTAAIGRVIGGIVPEVLAVHDYMMIQRDGGAIEDEMFDPEALIETVLKMQRVAVNRVDELEAGGLRVMDANWLACNVESILNHQAVEDFWRDEVQWGMHLLRKKGVHGIRSNVGGIRDVLKEIANLHLPNTVVHGDLGFQNIGCRMKNGGKDYCFFDWVRSFVGHPLIDFQHIISNDEAISGLSINRETAIRQFAKEWMPSSRNDEIESLLDPSFMMFNLARIYDLTQLYEVADDNQRALILALMEGLIFNLKEDIDCMFPDNVQQSTTGEMGMSI